MILDAKQGHLVQPRPEDKGDERQTIVAEGALKEYELLDAGEGADNLFHVDDTQRNTTEHQARHILHNRARKDCLERERRHAALRHPVQDDEAVGTGEAGKGVCDSDAGGLRSVRDDDGAHACAAEDVGENGRGGGEGVGARGRDRVFVFVAAPVAKGLTQRERCDVLRAGHGDARPAEDEAKRPLARPRLITQGRGG